jgi:hypothetical protein
MIREVQFSEMPPEAATIVPIDIPVSFRGVEVDTTSMIGQHAPRAHGQHDKLRWQLFSWQHEPASEIFEIQAANEISLGQLVAEFVGQFSWAESTASVVSDGRVRFLRMSYPKDTFSKLRQ